MTIPANQAYLLRVGPGGGLPDNFSGNRSGIQLNRRQVCSLRGGHAPKAVVCVRGRVWITQEKDLQDYILEPGEIFILTLRGRAVVYGLEPSRIEIINDLRPVTNQGSYEQSISR